MLRFIIILAITVYVISKIASFFFKAGISSSNSRYQQQRRPDAPSPSGSGRKDRKNGTIKGGEYVDYEEIK